jgi:putative hydrolase of the HAD superfamily
MTRVVFFDLGKVLLNFDWMAASKRAAAQCEADPLTMARWITTSRHTHDYECGRLTSRQFFEHARAAIGFRGGFEEFAVLWSDIFTEMPETIALVRELKGRVPMALLSNTNEMHIDWVMGRWNFMRLFDDMVLSFREGCAKPEPEIYRRAIAKFSVKSAEAFFVDDRPENVAGALAAGMDVVLFTDVAALRAELATRGILRGH